MFPVKPDNLSLNPRTFMMARENLHCSVASIWDAVCKHEHAHIEERRGWREKGRVNEGTGGGHG